MPLSVGDKLGHYEVVSLLGQGGMGEVYRARDTILKRDVALKVLPEVALPDPERMARFQREAEVLASLDHPNIGPIYGLVDAIDSRALVLALIDGPTLADRIEAGRIPLGEAIAISKQIIEALEYAHDRGVVHRDLKPANVKITAEGIVKVLDFGLAKVLDDESSASSPANSPTITLGHTRAGVILGTAAYMSPEQAVGRPVDRRSDIFSFGAVLYEMLTGKRAFGGATTPDVLEAIVKDDPDWSALPQGTPVYVRRLLERTLAKDRKQRLQAIGEARLVLAHPPSDAPVLVSSAPSPMKWLWPWVAAMATIVAGTIAVVHYREPRPSVPRAVRFQIPAAPNTGGNGGPLVVSPDGRWITSWVRNPAGLLLAVRALDETEWRTLAGSETQSAPPPFWTPDSRYIVFGADRKIKKIDVINGGVVAVTDGPPPVGGDGNADGWLIVGTDPGVISRVKASGGALEPVTIYDRSRGDLGDWNPRFLPDGQHFLYEIRSTDAERAGTYIASVNAKPQEQPSNRILASGARFVPGTDDRSGYVVFAQGDSLMAQSFDPHAMRVTGEPMRIPGAGSYFGVSRNGVLAYRNGTGGQNQLTWFDRKGKILRTSTETNNAIALSPTGDRLVVSRTRLSNTDLWLEDLARSVTTRLTSGPARDEAPVWSGDGTRLAFTVSETPNADLYQVAATGAAAPELILKSPVQKWANDWSRDGRFLLYSAGQSVNLDLWYLALEDRQPKPYIASPFRKAQAQFSPDGRFVAYTSNESGSNEVYVSTFPNSSGGKWTISKGGGLEPHWRADGKELLYVYGRKLMSVDVALKPGFQPKETRTLFEAPLLVAVNQQDNHRWQVAPDGNSFVMMTSPADDEASPITVVLNWQALLKTE